MKISEKILQVKEIKKTYGSGENRTEALRGMTFDVIPGEFLGIMGASGSGKTTLLNCIATILHPTSGQIMLGERIYSHLMRISWPITGVMKLATCFRNLNCWII